MPSVFEILEINPTTDFEVVKKAYRKMIRAVHPDKWNTASEEVRNQKEELAKQVTSAFELVNDEEKLQRYFTNQTPVFVAANPADSDDIPTDLRVNSSAIRKKRTGPVVTVFIPVPVNYQTPDSRAHYISPKAKNNTDIDWGRLAKAIEELFKEMPRQVGIDWLEAKKVLEQHSFSSPYIIAEVSVPLDAFLSDAKFSEQDFYPRTVLNARNEDYFWLRQGICIRKESIKSISHPAMILFCSWRHDRSDQWPENVKKFINPSHKTPELPAANRTAFSLFHSAKPVEYLIQESSNFTEQQQKDIHKVINQLDKEIKSCWPYPNKDRKQNKIDALNELLELSNKMSVLEAIEAVEKKFSNIRDGRLSKRTANLLNNLKDSYQRPVYF